MHRTGLTSAECWGVTDDEQAKQYTCDAMLPDAPGRWMRGVDVHADPATTFDWVCQLRAAPYSYDLLDNFGRRSPRTRQPWCRELEVGQPVMTIFTLVSFEKDVEMTLRLNEGLPQALFGELVMTYQVAAVESRTRLVVAMRVGNPPGPGGVARRRLLAAGDLVMMRKQLLTLARLAEAR